MGKFAKVFIFYLNQLNKLFVLMRRIPITDFMSLYDLFIVTTIITALIFVVKMGMKINDKIMYSVNTANWYKKNFGKKEVKITRVKGAK